MTQPASGVVKGQLVRFVLAGAVNTAVSLAVYWALLVVAPYQLAYTVGYAIGALSAFALNTYFVFRVPWSWGKLLAFPLVHVANYAFGLALLSLLIALGVPENTAPLLSIPGTVPFSFVISRLLMRARVDPDRR